MVDEIYSFESMKSVDRVANSYRDDDNLVTDKVIQNLRWLTDLRAHARRYIPEGMSEKDFLAVFALLSQAALDEPKWNKNFCKPL